MFMARPWCACWYWCLERRLQQREDELNARERRLQELEAVAHRYQPERLEPGSLAEKMWDALGYLEDALEAWGGREGRGGREDWGGDTLREARRLLEKPGAKSAASALIAIGEVAESCDEEALNAVRTAERAVRDVVVLRCCAPGGIGTISHDDILPALEVAFDKPLQGDFLPRADQQLKCCMLLAYHKLRLRHDGRRPRRADGLRQAWQPPRP